MSDSPRVTTRTTTTRTTEYELDERAIESAVMRGLGLPPGTEFVWDVSQFTVRSLAIRHHAIVSDQEVSS